MLLNSQGARSRDMTSHFSPEINPLSLFTALRDGIAQLERETVPSAGLAAELLLMHAIGRDRTWIYAHPEAELNSAQREQYFSLIARRASGEPTQHLTEHQEFWGLDFEVSPSVLIPRPETEHLIEVALERLGITNEMGAQRRNEKFRIADVGTGSGCIAISLARELPYASIIATDISVAALDVARRNAARHGVSDRVELLECNLLDALFYQSPATGHQSSPIFDLIVSNPPYIGRWEAASLAREVREHEPEAALYGGELGTEFYAPVLTQAAALLKPGGLLVVELGHTSTAHVANLLASSEWASVLIANDLAGIPRIASAVRTIK
jgi:release factor glutamine methyltransferase